MQTEVRAVAGAGGVGSGFLEERLSIAVAKGRISSGATILASSQLYLPVCRRLNCPANVPEA